MKVISKSKSKSLVFMVYDISKRLPREENYVLKPQICKAAILIPSNLAEGSQKSKKDFMRFIKIARGSLEELKIQLQIIESVYPIDCSVELSLCDEIGKMTYGLLLKLKT